MKIARAACLLAVLLVAAPASASAHTKADVTVDSKADGTPIVISVYRPDGATAASPKPVILHSHGWGGSRTSSAGAFKTELDNGYGVVSIDQRGHGASGGQANVEDPEFEGQDMISVIDYVAGLDWVEKDRRTGRANDPVLFAMGGSYGGGYQFVAAFTELRDLGYTRLNALAPEITWYDLPQALAPSKVARTAWVTLLYGAGAPMLPQYVHEAFAYGATTGQWADGTVPGIPNLQEEFFEHGPAGHVAAGRRLGIPVLLGQGLNDNLFNFNEAWKNLERALTPTARARSLVVGYNGGHALPNVLPAGVAGSGDSCSGEGGFSALRNRFFGAVRGGRDTSRLLPARYSLSTTTDTCVRTERVDVRRAYPVGVDAEVTRGTATTSGAGAPQHHEIAKGPMTIAGVPTLDATVTSAGADQRVFFAISVGTSPADATVVHNNTMPLRELLPVVRQRRTVELPGIAVDVPAGENAYLTITPVSDMFFGHGSVRTPGAVTLEDMTVNLPVVVAPASSKGAGKPGKPDKSGAAKPGWRAAARG
jgi:ABC-2 type transport system ATP-binding protein